MAAAVEVGLYVGALLALTVVVASVIQYELELGTFVSALTAVSATSAGLMAALALQAGLEVPVLWSVGSLAGLILLFVVLYEVFS